MKQWKKRWSAAKTSVLARWWSPARRSVGMIGPVRRHFGEELHTGEIIVQNRVYYKNESF